MNTSHPMASARTVSSVLGNWPIRILFVIIATALAATSFAADSWPYSQLNPMWKNEKVGTSRYTIGSIGCAITSCANMLVAVGQTTDPSTLNTWLTKNKGYKDQCLLKWDKIAENSGGKLKWKSFGTIPATPTQLKKLLDSGHKLVAYSTRAGKNTDHWVLITSYTNGGTKWQHFQYLDPLDKQPSPRYLGDKWVNAGAQTRQFTLVSGGK